ncbi:MAG: hypothetical protein WD670_02075, partial [Actinomycetota bacterium]
MVLSTLIAAVVLSASVFPPGQDGGPGFAGSSGDAGDSVVPAVLVQPPGSVPGIDISHHQDHIDWSLVADSGK